MYLYVMYAWMPAQGITGHWIPWGYIFMQHGTWEPNLVPLEEQKALLTVEPSQHYIIYVTS